MQNQKNYIPLIFLFILSALLAGCWNAGLEEFPPEEIVAKSAARMEQVETFEFEIFRDGAPAYLDQAETLVLRKMTGAFVAPESAEAKVKVILATTGVSVSLDIISIGEIQYESQPLTGLWVELPPGGGFNPAELFDIDIGLKHILENDILELSLEEPAEIESMPGRKLYFLTGKLDAANLSTMTYELIGKDEIDFKIWIDPETFDLHQMEMVEHSGTNFERIWLINFWNFDQPNSIEAPIP